MISEHCVINKRDSFIDFLKGIGIILVLIGHIPELNVYVIRLIFSFHMPLFIALSGIFSTKSLGVGVKKLLLSYSFFAISLSIVYYSIFKNEFSPMYVFKCIMYGGSAPYRIEASPAMWFLSALIVLKIVTYLINGICNKVYRYIIVISLSIIGIIANDFLVANNMFVPWNVVIAMMLLPFFYTGKYLMHFCVWIRERIWFAILIVLFLGPICVWSAYQNGLVNIFRGQYGERIWMYYLNGILGIVLITAFSSLLFRTVFLKKSMEWIGQNSIVFMCIHQIIYKIIENVIDTTDILLKLTEFVAAVAVCILVSKMRNILKRRVVI